MTSERFIDANQSSSPKAILLTLPLSMASAVDAAAIELGQTRLAFIRECIRRGLRYYEANERAQVLRLREQAEKTMSQPPLAP